MAKKPQIRYVCTNCGAISAAWAGRCVVCGEWNSLQEEVTLINASGSQRAGHHIAIESLTTAKNQHLHRLSCGNEELDEVFGGGIVPGSINLLTGHPGIGKSTMVMQIAQSVAESNSVLYVSGEESSQQISLRADRLHIKAPQLKLATSTIADDIVATISSGTYQLLIIDSIQTMTANNVLSAAGSVSQISACTQLIMSAAKQSQTAVILIGHVTKEGQIAGPKVLEHIVDVVLLLEGDSYGGLKILRTSKNRFGSTNVVGIFEMTETGLQVVKNPSASLLAERQISDGSIIFAGIEGNRPILVEVQALVNRTNYGYPKRTASGIDLNRMNLLVAMLERRTKLNLADQDIFINIVGGLKITEPAIDLAICMAIGSAAKGLQLKANMVVFGEVGLAGEIRHVPFIEKRLDEARKLGFHEAIGPVNRTRKTLKGLNSVTTVRTALNQYLQKD